MKRAIWITVTAFILVLAIAIPSQARHLATRCRTHAGPDGPDGVSFQICVHVNAHDGWLALGKRRIQSKLIWDGTGGETSRSAVRITLYDLVLFRGASAVRYTGSHTLRSWVRTSFGTGWFDVPRRASDIEHTASTGYKLTWVNWPGNPTSKYSTLAAGPWFG